MAAGARAGECTFLCIRVYSCVFVCIRACVGLVRVYARVFYFFLSAQALCACERVCKCDCSARPARVDPMKCTNAGARISVQTDKRTLRFPLPIKDEVNKLRHKLYKLNGATNQSSA